MPPGRAVVAAGTGRLRPAPDALAVFGLLKLLQRLLLSDGMLVRSFILASPVQGNQ